MEKEFFEYEDWDPLDTLVLCFYNCILLKQIGIFPPGTYVASITMDYEKGYISIYKNIEDSDTEYKYKLKLSIGDELERY